MRSTVLLPAAHQWECSVCTACFLFGVEACGKVLARADSGRQPPTPVLNVVCVVPVVEKRLRLRGVRAAGGSCHRTILSGGARVLDPCLGAHGHRGADQRGQRRSWLFPVLTQGLHPRTRVGRAMANAGRAKIMISGRGGRGTGTGRTTPCGPCSSWAAAAAARPTSSPRHWLVLNSALSGKL